MDKAKKRMDGSPTIIAVCLFLCAIATAHPSAIAASQFKTEAECSPLSIPIKMVKGPPRIEVSPGQILKAGEPNHVLLTLNSPGMTCAEIEETGSDGNSPISGTETNTRILTDSTGQPFVAFTPVRLGRVGIFVGGQFADGAWDKTRATVDVIPSDQRPAAVIIQIGGLPGKDHDHYTLVLPTVDKPRNESTAWTSLFPAAFYAGLRSPIEIEHSFMRYKVKQPENDPIIEVNPSTGGMRPIRLGTALLEASFGGMTRQVCIRVSPDDSSLVDDPACTRLRSVEPPAPLDTTWSYHPEGLASEIFQSEFFAGSLAVDPPNHPVNAREPFELPIEVTGGEIRSITCQQRASGSHHYLWGPVNNNDPTGLFVPLEKAVVLRDDGPRKTLEVIPLGIGGETVVVAVHFRDGGFVERYFRMQVEPHEK